MITRSDKFNFFLLKAGNEWPHREGNELVELNQTLNTHPWVSPQNQPASNQIHEYTYTYDREKPTCINNRHFRPFRGPISNTSGARP